VDGVNGAHGMIKLTLTNAAASATSLRFTLSSLQRSSGQFSATLTGPASTSVQVDTSPDLFKWSLKTTVTLNGSGSGNFTDNSATASHRFYRSRNFNAGLHSCNVVGYADLPIVANVFKMIANPFNAVDNRVAALIPSPPNNTGIWKYNPASGGYTSIQYISGLGWEGDDVNMTLAPGEGVYIQSPVSWTLTFAGEVAQGHSVNPVDNGVTIRSSIVPQRGRVVTDLHLPVWEGDTVKREINGSQVTYTYQNGTWSPEEPVVEIGESFWNTKSIGFWWHRNFLVWP
jgi:hypothetical protein